MADEPVAPSGPPPGPPPSPPPTAAAPAGPPPSAPAAGASGASRDPRRRWRAAFVVLALAAGALTAYAASSADDSSPSAPAAQGPGEVFLEPARSAGQEPFSSDVDALAPGVTPVVLPASTTSAPVPSAATTSASGTGTTAAPPVVLASSSGTTPGLYGGTRAIGSCDVAAIDRFLAENPDKSAAWAGAIGIAPRDVNAYLRSLTPVLLLADTRVTNHGYRNGVATPLQSVLQAGTAVLVDATGVPRVKCACGNPLKEPLARSQSVTYTGNRWSGFEPTRIVVVTPGPATDRLIIQDIAGGPPLARPVGTTGASDTVAPADAAATVVRVPVSIPPTTSARPTTTGSATTRATGTTAVPPTTTVLPASGDFCARVRAYEAINDRDFEVNSDWSFRSGKTDAEFGRFLDAAFRELAAVAPGSLAADLRTVSDWWQPTMGARDLFGAGVAVPENVAAAIGRMNNAIDACG